MRIMVRVPCQGQIDGATAEWMLWAQVAGDQKNHDMDIARHEAHGYGVANARNDILREFLAGDDDVLWMVDSDTVPPRSLRILDGLPVREAVSGAYLGMTEAGVRWHLYRQREGSTELWDLTPPPESIQQDRWFRVDATGMGCFLITRELAESLPPDPFEFRRDATGAWIGEDLLFCQRLGGVWVDSDYICEHNRRTPLLRAWQWMVKPR